uniref:UDG domain-containing protein n=1 Tax=Steinernema glaseri TaxID=37863 RepID=A0A1I7Y3H6_9BILA
TMARSSSQAPAAQLSLIGEEILSGNLLTENILTQAARLPSDWRATLDRPELQDILATLAKWLDKECQDGASIYPAAPFRALELLPLQKVSVVILGQDPYHGPNQAQGLSFSVPDTCPAPPSLRNIFKELELEYPNTALPSSHDLSNWGRQGVLLLNTSLTVEDGLPASHAKKELSSQEQHALWSNELLEQYAWQFQGETPFAVPSSSLPLLDELFKFVNETIKDSFDRSLFCWTDLKQDSKGLTAWYLGVEDYDEVLEPYIE